MPRILSVGQCGYDHGMMARQLGKGLGADVVGVGSCHEAIETLRGGPFDLVLVNRINDRDGSPGLDLIRTMKADPGLSSVPVMLVSNYPEAQKQAEALGALPGFGKAEIGSPSAQERLKSALAAKPPMAPSPG